jgi:hypothetical protein
MTKPIRVQLKRTKGWLMPENTVKVTRPGKWGNPIKLVGDMIYIDAGYRRKILDKWVLVFEDGGYNVGHVIALFECIITGIPEQESDSVKINPDILFWIDHFKKLDISELKGKNLACFCGLDQPCHADTLLRLANK